MIPRVCNSSLECFCDLGQVFFFGAGKIFAYFSSFFSSLFSQVAEMLLAKLKIPREDGSSASHVENKVKLDPAPVRCGGSTGKDLG